MIKFSKKFFSVEIRGPYSDKNGSYFNLFAASRKKECRMCLSAFVKSKSDLVPVPMYIDYVYCEEGDAKKISRVDCDFEIVLPAGAIANYKIRSVEKISLTEGGSVVFKIKDRLERFSGFKTRCFNWNLSDGEVRPCFAS
jgi:hypothetical protein